MTTELITSTSTFRSMLRLALPVLVEESLNMLVGYTDWWLTGHYLPGVEFKAAMGLMVYAMWLIPSLFSAIAIGATAMTSRFIGAGDRLEATKVTNQSLLLGMLVAVIVTLCVAFGGPVFTHVMQLRGDAETLAVRYLNIVSFAIPFIMFEQVAVSCLHGAGDTISGSLAKIAVNVVNMGVSSSLVLGLGPFPRVGWDGLPIAVVCGHSVGGLILLGMLIAGRSGLKIDSRIWKPDWSLIRRLLRIGIPGGIDILMILFCHLVYLSIINQLGEAAAAAHGLGIQIEAMSFLPGSAFQVAASTLSGQFLGAGDPRRAKHAVFVTMLSGASVMSAAAAMYYFGGLHIAGFFTGDLADPTAVQSARLLRLVAISTPFLAVLMIFNGALRGAGDTRLPLVFTLFGFLGIRLPAACFLAWSEFVIPGTGLTIHGAGWGIEGAWIAMAADVMVRALLVSFRFWHGGWQHVKV